MSRLSIEKYLVRVGLNHRPPPTLEGLREIHQAHLVSVPYEVLDVQLGRPVSIAIEPIYEKIVDQRRGGWCYEMNGIFGWALGELGFDVLRATGAVMRETGGDGQIGNHLVLGVELKQGAYLADVGFGDGPLFPIQLREGPFSANEFSFRLERIDRYWWRLHNHQFGGARSFDFNLERANEDLLAAKCLELQTAPKSTFVQNLLCFRHKQGGIDALIGKVLREVRPFDVKSRVLESAEDLRMTLSSVFQLDEPGIERLWPKICAGHERLLAQAAAL